MTAMRTTHSRRKGSQNTVKTESFEKPHEHSELPLQKRRVGGRIADKAWAKPPPKGK